MKRRAAHRHNSEDSAKAAKRKTPGPGGRAGCGGRDFIGVRAKSDCTKSGYMGVFALGQISDGQPMKWQVRVQYKGKKVW